MPIISVKGDKSNRWKRNAKTKNNKIKQKTEQGDGNYSERMRDKWFCGAFKLGLS